MKKCPTLYDCLKNVFSTTFLPVFLICFGVSLLKAQDLDIVNIRVGQGDATLIQGPVRDDSTRVNILVDGGDISDRDGGHILRTVLYKRDVRKLDYVIVTHYDADHIGGIVSGEYHGTSFLLGWNEAPGWRGDDDWDGVADWLDEEYWTPDPEEFGTGDDIPVGHFVDRGDDSASGTQAYRKYILIAEAHNNRISLENRTDIENFEIDLGDGATMKALAANGYVRERPARVAYANTENERSLSFLVSYGAFDYLISGDLIGRRAGGENARVERAVGQYIKNTGIIVDVLHVNHHGANNASEAGFLADIKPTIAIISAGNGNRYSHPNHAALKRLASAGIYRIIQTSWGTTSRSMPKAVREVQAIYQNDVIISSDGTQFTISTSRSFKTDYNPNR